MASDGVAAVRNFESHAEHFKSAEHERRAGQLGTWLFMCNEVLLFAGLFTAFSVYRYMYTDTFRWLALQELNWQMGTVNTVVLLFSSFTVVGAVHAAHHKKSVQAGWWLVASIFFAGVFLVIKYFEYSHKIHEGLLPGKYFSYDLVHAIAEKVTAPEHGIDVSKVGPGAQIFFTLYFFITGLHGIHVLVGMGLLTWIAIRAFKGEFARSSDMSVELVGMYWHIVDLIWIFVYPMLYLL
jgi:cytochrome c oxidase subunit 3